MNLSVSIQKKLADFQLNVSFEAADGVTGLLGASGCGKSLTLQCIAGVMRPDRGRIVLGDRVLFDSDRGIDLPPQRRRVGLLFQHYALFPNLTVVGNIAAGAADKSQVPSLMAAFRLEGLEGHYPHQLSGGQQQRVALARMLAARPDAILLDEPFSALDSYLRWQVELELADVLADFPGPAVLVSHSRDEIYRLCRQVCVLHHGASEPVTGVAELFQSPGTVASCLLSGCKNLSPIQAAADGRVQATDWGVTLTAARPAAAGDSHIGIRAHSLTLTSAPGNNVIHCVVDRVVDDVFSTLIMARTPGGGLLRWKLGKEQWAALGQPTQVFLFAPPNAIMVLQP